MYIDIVVNENDLNEDVSVLICDYDYKFKDEVKCIDRGSITSGLRNRVGEHVTSDPRTR